MKLNEKLDFNLNINDIILIDELFLSYLNDRSLFYEELFLNSQYQEQDKKKYINYFISPCLEDEIQHEGLYRIQHFINRNYEFFTLPNIDIAVYNLKRILNIDYETLSNIDDFENYEYDLIVQLKKYWDEFINAVKEYPILNLDNLRYENIKGIQLYYAPDTSEFCLSSFKEFIVRIQKEFPVCLKRMDTWILIDPDYIEFVAGDGTTAYYLDDTIFFPNKVESEDENFFVVCLYHELGHFLFELMSETSQHLWYQSYSKWIRNKLKLTREEGKNEVEELFADVTALYFSPVQDEFITQPSSIILDTWKSIVDREFKR